MKFIENELRKKFIMVFAYFTHTKTATVRGKGTYSVDMVTLRIKHGYEQIFSTTTTERKWALFTLNCKVKFGSAYSDDILFIPVDNAHAFFDYFIKYFNIRKQSDTIYKKYLRIRERLK